MTYHIRKPQQINGQWCVVISESESPLSKTVAVFRCGSRESAFQIYRQLMKEKGKML